MTIVNSTNILAGTQVAGNAAHQTVSVRGRIAPNEDNAPYSGTFEIGGKYGVLRLHGIAEDDTTATVCHVDVVTGAKTPVVRNGVTLQLDSDNTMITLDADGYYILLLDGDWDSAHVTLNESMLMPLAPASVTTPAAAEAVRGVLFARIPVTYEYTTGNAYVEWDTPAVVAGKDESFTFTGTHFTPTDGAFFVGASVRATVLSGGTYFRLRVMSGLNTVAEDRFEWGASCAPAAVTIALSTLVSSAQASNKVLHVLIETDADMTNAFLDPSQSHFVAYRVGDVP